MTPVEKLIHTFYNSINRAQNCLLMKKNIIYIKSNLLSGSDDIIRIRKLIGTAEISENIQRKTLVFYRKTAGTKFHPHTSHLFKTEIFEIS